MKISKENLKKYLNRDMELQMNQEEMLKEYFSGAIRDILKIAVENCIVPNFDGVVLLNTKTGELSGDSWTSSTFVGGDHGVDEIYRLKGNWIANSCMEYDDLLTDDEWEELQKKYGEDEACFENRKQVESIGVNFLDRITDFIYQCFE